MHRNLPAVRWVGGVELELIAIATGLSCLSFSALYFICLLFIWIDSIKKFFYGSSTVFFFLYLPESNVINVFEGGRIVPRFQELTPEKLGKVFLTC